MGQRHVFVYCLQVLVGTFIVGVWTFFFWMDQDQMPTKWPALLALNLCFVAMIKVTWHYMNKLARACLRDKE